MASLSPLRLPRPSCGTNITVPVSATPGERREDSATLAVSLDPGPIREHVEQHRGAPGWLTAALYDPGEA